MKNIAMVFVGLIAVGSAHAESLLEKVLANDAYNLEKSRQNYRNGSHGSSSAFVASQEKKEYVAPEEYGRLMSTYKDGSYEIRTYRNGRDFRTVTLFVGLLHKVTLYHSNR